LTVVAKARQDRCDEFAERSCGDQILDGGDVLGEASILEIRSDAFADQPVSPRQRRRGGTRPRKIEALGGRDLAARSAMRKLPQRLVNVRVSDRDAAMGSDELNKAVQAACHELEGRGRVLVRPSGTEQLVRVMVEAPDADEADAVCARLVAVVERTASPA